MTTADGSARRTAAALIIGNEVLTGKVQEANVAVLGQTLFALGVELRRVVICPDEIEGIAADLNGLRASHDLVFTSGGVGPTHDDITIDAVAHAFGRRVVRSAEIERLIRGYHEPKGNEVTEAHLRMANVVEGARLVRTAEVLWPTLALENVYVLPGVPEVFRLKLEVLKDELARGEGFVSHAVYTQCDEGAIAKLLADVAEAHPGVTIGSYLKWRSEDYRTKITFDGPDEAAVMAAADEFVAGIGADELVRRG
ncbi:MAG TPA: molybdopterin-binding protein [Polyangiaceae bacterium LLY-WYZ-15_(1-7)]|nr:competence/damage-inducible protein A [Myxococcales bacterium]MAT23509.1 competence/damage-inducible protein A [Sandaracinus sp.]HJK90980.1 molybdopterin-binding protein [Polyangiaceae bacterium LLY-WYZ-15_(1-7)]HJL02630.1 molybdopterin-binding protein [Polyangiaceae bacterium LLY-WYZ-15_(1-7)]HJL11300.1 molybdopterin-binding protein [Polyangiaceae bacterium LLY-WYZ-15_(1-7)]